MSDEYTQVKISIPAIDEIDLKRIDENYNDIVSEYTKALIEKREQTIFQRLMMNLQQENQKLTHIIEELEKWLKEKSVGYKMNTQIYSYDICCQALDKLKQLQEEDK